MHITTDQMAGAASFIERNWGSHGYAVELIESPTWAVSLFHVVARDGSRFIIAADRFGNCRAVAEGQGWRAVADELHAAATAV